MIVLNSPNNPSGTVYTEKVLRNIATVLENIQTFLFYLMKFMNILTME